MKFHILSNDENYIVFNIVLFFNSPARKRSILIGRLTPLAVFVFSVLLSVICDFDQLFILIEVVILGAYSVYGFFFYPKEVKKVLEKGNLRKGGKLPYEADLII